MKRILLSVLFSFLVLINFAASRYWVGGHPTNNNWNQTGSGTTNWSTTSGGAAGASVPGASDDVIFDGAGANGNSNSTVSATITILSLTITSGYTSTITHNAVITNGGALTMHTGYTIAGSSAMQFTLVSHTITSGGKSWPNNLTVSAGAGTCTLVLVGDFTVGGTISTSTNVSIQCDKTTSEILRANGLNQNFINGNFTGTAEFRLTGGTWTCSSSGGMANSGGFGFEGGTVTISGTCLITNTFTGTVKYYSGTVSGGTLSINPTCTLDLAGTTFNNITFATTGKTYTLSSALSATTISFSAAATHTFAGTAGWTCETLSCVTTAAQTITLKEGITYTVTGTFSANFSQTGAKLAFTSAHGTTKANLILSNGAVNNVLADFTRIDASGGRPIRSFNGTITDCVNIHEFHDLKTVAK